LFDAKCAEGKIMAKLTKYEPVADPPKPLTSVSSDLTFLTNEAGNTHHDRFTVLLKKDICADRRSHRIVSQESRGRKSHIGGRTVARRNKN
jgi:hypothetical protein